MSGVVEEEKKEQESLFRASDWSPHLPVLTLLLAFVLFVFNLCLILQVLGEPPPQSGRFGLALVVDRLGCHSASSTVCDPSFGD